MTNEQLAILLRSIENMVESAISEVHDNLLEIEERRLVDSEGQEELIFERVTEQVRDTTSTPFALIPKYITVPTEDLVALEPFAVLSEWIADAARKLEKPEPAE